MRTDELTQAIALLDEHNKWRQGVNDNATDPKELTKALHTVVREYPLVLTGRTRYEKLRRVTVPQFQELCSRNIRGQNFDKMVDEL